MGAARFITSLLIYCAFLIKFHYIKKNVYIFISRVLGYVFKQQDGKKAINIKISVLKTKPDYSVCKVNVRARFFILILIF